MKKLLGLILALALVLSCAAFAEEAAPALQKDLVILYTSDVHCGIDQGWGYAGLYAVKESLSQDNYVLLVDDGDAIQGEPIGTMTKGEAIIDIMNTVGYDIAIPGNHEFDYGMERFMELVEMADFPYISCNFHREGELVFDPYVIREFDGVKFGFVGATTPESLTSSTPLYFQDENGNYIYDFSQGGDGSEFYAAVQKAVDDARAEGAAYVFLIAHLGNEASCHPYTYADVIEHTNGIDAVLDGHSHDTEKVVMKNKDGKSVIRQACGTKLASIGWMRVSAEDGTVETGLYNWNNDVPAPELLGIWNRMSVELEKTDNISKQLEEVVGHAAVELTVNDPEAKDESGKPLRIVRNAETNLGDFCADVMRAAAGADVGVANGGAIRVSIEKGDITLNDLLSVYPFGNKLMMAEVTGQQLLNALEWGVRVLPSESGAFLHVSGMTYEIHTGIKSTCTKDDNGLFTGVAGEYRVQNVMVNGEPLDLEKTYTVVSTSNVIVNHGDGQTAFDGAKIVWTSDELDYQIMKDYIQSLPDGVVGEGYENPYGQERIVAVE